MTFGEQNGGLMPRVGVLVIQNILPRNSALVLSDIGYVLVLYIIYLT